MRNGKEILLYILIAIAAIFIIFAIVKYQGNKTELRTVIEEFQTAENRIIDIAKQLKEAGSIIDNLQESIEQERIDYSRLEENNSQLEIAIAEQRELYKRFAESNKSDSSAINNLEKLNESNENIIREILRKIDD